LCSSSAPPAPPPFPTRRSSDLALQDSLHDVVARRHTHVRDIVRDEIGLQERLHAPDTGAVQRLDGNDTRRATRIRGPAHEHRGLDRKSTRLNSSHVSISYAVFC